MQTNHPMFVEFHIIQNFAPTVLNRDQANLPKECYFGGTRRARVSSQSWKRAVRENEEFVRIVGASHIGDRSKNLVRHLVQRLHGKDAQKYADQSEVAQLVSKFVAWYVDGSSGKAIDEKTGENYKTTVQLFFSTQEVDWLQEQLELNWNNLQPLQAEQKTLSDKLDSLQKDRKKKQEEANAKAKEGDKKAKKTTIPQSDEEKKLEEQLGKNNPLSKKLQDMAKAVVGKALVNRAGIKKTAVNAADIALFGRMVASNTDLNVDAACQYGQAISTHSVQMETDFFVAMDDLPFPGDQGGDMLGQQDYNGSCYYRYARVDLGQLLFNLGDSEELKDAERKAEIRQLAHKSVEGFARAFLESVPAAKRGSHDNNAEPTFALAVVRKRGRSWSMVNAFERPVPLSRAGFLCPSIEQFDNHWKRMHASFDDPKDTTIQAALMLNVQDNCPTPNLSAEGNAQTVVNASDWAAQIADTLLPNANKESAQQL